MLSNERKLINSSDESNLKELQKIASQDLNLKSNHINYFLRIAHEYAYHEKSPDVKRVGIIGSSIPEELIIACGAKPVWIFGGSFDCANYSDSLVARDTDPMVKSFLGMLLSESFPSFQNIDLLVVCPTSDSMRKAGYMLSKHFNTFIIDIPPIKERKSSYIKWRKQLEKMTEKICSLTGKKLKKSNIKIAAETIYKAKKQIKRFIKNHKKNKNLLSASLFVLILNSYFMASNLKQWTMHLEALNNEMEKSLIYKLENFNNEVYKPNVLLIGSSIFFPNMKIPTLFDDSGLDLYHLEMDTVNYLNIIPNLKTGILNNNLLNNISDTYYANNTSHAFVNNKTKISALEKLISTSPIEGVVYHVIRGQVSCDFEFESIENFFIEHDIPIMRLETDYNYQDIEQLRIRLEAFGEMIKAKYNSANTHNNNSRRARA